jgi:hypothetical protein
MMRRLVGWFVLVPLCAVLIVFALANRQLVIVNFNPFQPPETLTAPGFGVPMFLVIYAVLILGVLLGGIAAWFSHGHLRSEKRALLRVNDRLSRELDANRRPPPGRPALADTDDLLDSV